MRLLPTLAMLVLVAAAGPAAGASAQERFLAAEKALRASNLHRYRDLVEDLHEYPLYPYLRYREYLRYISRTSPNQIRQFLNTWAGTPLEERLRATWLIDLAQKGKWETYLAFYRPSPKTIRRCHFRLAQLHTGFEAAAFSGIEDLWLSARSQPRECDPLFKAWHEAGGLTPELVRARIALSMEYGQTRVARFLKRYGSDKDREWTDLWLRVRRDPALVTRDPLLRKDHPQREQILAYGVRRMARTDPEKALAAWEKLSAKHDFEPALAGKARLSIAIAFARKNHPDALGKLAEFVPDDAIARRLYLVTALQRADWQAIDRVLATLPDDEKSNPQWRYWQARALEHHGKKEEAKRLYAGLSLASNYYGLMAADRLGIDYPFETRLLNVNSEELDALRRRPAVQRIEELLALERITDARREWNYLTNRMRTPELLVAARLAEEWQWHDRVITTLGKTPYRDHLQSRFPLPWRADVVSQASRRKLDPALVYAVARQESAFMADARSPAGATGLMQLMPGTARTVAREENFRLRSSRQLIDVPTNLRLGTAYLETMLDRFGGHPALALAAYNAGPHRVDKWLPDDGCIEGDVWVEGIPYRETRNYVKNVMTYMAIYTHHLKEKPKRLQAQLKPVPVGDGCAVAANEFAAG